MKRLLYASAVLILIAAPALLQTRAAGQTAPNQQQAQQAHQAHQAMLNTYCVGCHNSRAKVGGLALDGLNLQAAADSAETWEKALRKLRGHLMPPPGSPQPAQKDVDAFVGWMENTLDTQAKGPKTGHVPIQRLNRTEYAASVKALVGVDLKATDVLPQDGQVDGFDNIATALTVSPAFLSQYITAARQVAKLAIGSPNPAVASTKYTIAANSNPDVPLPLGTRGGIGFKHNFPAAGEYRFTINDLGVGIYNSTLENQSTLVIMVDGKIVFRQTIGGPDDWQLHAKGPRGRAQIMERFTKIPVQAEAGVHDVVVAFIDRSHVESPHNIADPFFDVLTLSCSCAPIGRRNKLVDGVVIAGPFNPRGISRTPSRDLIFVCDPNAKGESSCARQITETFAHRAFRRPVTADEVTRLTQFYESARKSGGTFDQGVEQMVAAVLASPNFLYRGIWGTPVTGRGGANTELALTDLELASRLSFFLWNTGPDEELLKLAEAGGLTKPTAPSVLEKQVRRMLADPKASSLVNNFAMKWLNLDSLESVKPDPVLFPGFTDQLRRDFSTEAEAFVSSIFLEDRNLVDLLTADHTFLNERLARHYGIPGVSGPQFRRVTLTDKERFGLLGKAAVLMRTSYADRTSPVLRGAWVLDKLLGTPPAPPPPDTATDLSQKAGEQPRTVRARLEQHRDKASCNMCHGVIDPTGLALENFDAIGAWRTVDGQAKAPIDASTVLPNGVAIHGVVELRAQLVDRPAMFVNAVTERLMMYAINRELEHFDMPQVRSIVRTAAKENYKLSSIVLGIVNSDSFRKQAPEAAPNAAAAR
jgi:mono/diheme cytochrome c family protein